MTPDFFQRQDLDFEQVKALTHAMLEVARVDGIHDAEMRLIREFYESCARAGDPRLEDVARETPGARPIAQLFDSQELASLFVKTLVLLAFADGTYAKAEEDVIRKYASELCLDGDAVDRLRESTKEFLLASLAHVQNLDALCEVRQKLETK